MIVSVHFKLMMGTEILTASGSSPNFFFRVQSMRPPAANRNVNPASKPRSAAVPHSRLLVTQRRSQALAHEDACASSAADRQNVNAPVAEVHRRREKCRVRGEGMRTNTSMSTVKTPQRAMRGSSAGCSMIQSEMASEAL